MHISRKFRLTLIAIASFLIVGVVLVLSLHKTVTLSVDGEARRITTYAFRVADLIHAQDIPLSPSDELSPPPNDWLKTGATITLVHAVPVQILADGKVTSIYSSERVPSSLLEQAGIEAGSDDLLLSNGKQVDPNQAFPPQIQSLSIQLIRSVNFTLRADGEDKLLSSTASTVGSALWAAGFKLFANDQLSPPANTPLTVGLVVTLTHSRLVTISTQAGDISFRTAAQTVGDALDAAHLSPQGLDYSIPTVDDPIPSNGKLRLVRVTEQVLVEQTPLPFETEYQPDSDLQLDNQSVLQAGAYGVSAQRVRVRYEDGMEASRKVEGEWVALQPKPRIIGYGTSVVMQTTTVDGVQIQYWRAVTMWATSYHPSEVGNTTASGLPLKKGVAAVDTSIVPFFTQLYIPGYGEAVAADIGGGVIGRWIDLGYSDDDYIPWHSWVIVYFLWPPPANIVWIIP